MTTTLEKRPRSITIEQALVQGDLAGLDAEQRIAYYLRVCESLNLNPYTKPFDYLQLNGRLVLYARKDATDQLRKIHRVSITRLEREQFYQGDLLVVTANASAADGRTDSAIGAVWTKGLSGEALANALMKAETKAKRRVTLSICGLGMTDEIEVDSIPGAERLEFDPPLPEEKFVPLSDRAPDEDRDLVRSADDRVWRRWLEVLGEAQSLGLNPRQVTLPVERQALVDMALQVVADIDTRKREAEAIGKR